MVPDILQKIVAAKKERLQGLRQAMPKEELKRRCADAAPVHDFAEALARPGIRIIAEAKKASPSKGLIAPDFDVVRTVATYEQDGAAACSILTEEQFFLGSLDYLRLARKTVSIPLLRKDFIFDDYQLFEAREAGADAILLIAAMLEDAQLEDLAGQAHDLGLAVLGEAHDAEEIDRLLSMGLRIIGVNARNLRTFQTNLGAVHDLIARIPETHLAVAESAIFTKADMEQVGARRFLIGEALMRKPTLLRELVQ